MERLVVQHRMDAFMTSGSSRGNTNKNIYCTVLVQKVIKVKLVRKVKCDKYASVKSRAVNFSPPPNFVNESP